MQAINRKDMHTDEFLELTATSIRRVRNAPRAAFSISTFLGLILLLAGSFGCAPSASPGDGGQNSSAAAAPNDTPEITDEIIRERINNAFLRQVPEENGAGKPISWNFDEDEPKEIVVVEKQTDGARATLLLDIKTQSAPNSREPRFLAGQIRTEWGLETGWVLRQWRIVKTENVSMKYKNLSQTPAQNSNR